MKMNATPVFFSKKHHYYDFLLGPWINHFELEPELELGTGPLRSQTLIILASNEIVRIMRLT
jgi:hypothetical protein